MLVDLTLRSKVVLVFGSGGAARARSSVVTAEGARVVRVASLRTPGRSARSRGPASGAGAAANPASLVRRIRPWVVFSTLDDSKSNHEISAAARAVGALVHVYDAPSLSDFTLPSVGNAGSIHVAVSTSGQSPAMAAVLRRRLEKSLRPEDVLQVRLQGRLRKTIRSSLPSFEARRDAVYRLLHDREIRRLLRANRFDRALAVARRQIASKPTPGTRISPRKKSR